MADNCSINILQNARNETQGVLDRHRLALVEAIKSQASYTDAIDRNLKRIRELDAAIELLQTAPR